MPIPEIVVLTGQTINLSGNLYIEALLIDIGSC